MPSGLRNAVFQMGKGRTWWQMGTIDYTLALRAGSLITESKGSCRIVRIFCTG